MKEGECLYIICHKDADGSFAGPSKIGISNDVDARVRQLQTGSALSIFRFGRWSFKDGGARKMERDLHKHFADAAIHGEWFSAAPSEIQREIDFKIDPHNRYGQDFMVP